MSSPAESWKHLHYSSDPRIIASVVTSIAAMEYDVRSVDANGRPVSVDELGEATGPFSIEVRPESHAELVDVLDEIVAEQIEFDVLLDHGRQWTRKQLLVSIAAILGIVLFLWVTFAIR